MDLYKWAYKIAPWIPAELVADTFELAVWAREIDMRASPYDLRHFGFEPIRIETLEGRAEYLELQQGVAQAAQTLRRRLLEAYRALRAVHPPIQPDSPSA
jgi:hypothetical protein